MFLVWADFLGVSREPGEHEGQFQWRVMRAKIDWQHADLMNFEKRKAMTKTTHRRRLATRAESAKALANVQQLFGMATREKAEVRFERYKREYGEATRALRSYEPGAIDRADDAPRELNEARRELAGVDAEAER
jgi:hypothetical protein